MLWWLSSWVSGAGLAADIGSWIPRRSLQNEARIFQAAGFTGPTRLEVPGWVVDRDVEEVVASVFSTSYAAPHLFGDRVGQFEDELRTMLKQASPTGLFSEEMREIAVDLWRR